MGQQRVKSCTSAIQTWQKAYFGNCWTEFLRFFLITSSFERVLSLAYFPHMGLPMDHNRYLWNHLKPDFLRSKLYGSVFTCSCATSWSFAHLIDMGLPMVAHLTPYGLAHRRKCTSLKLLDGPIQNSMELSKLVVLQRHGHLPFWPICACPWVGAHVSETRLMDFLGSKFSEIV